MERVKVRRLLALGIAAVALVVPLIAVVPAANAAEPMSASCASQTEVVRLMTATPSCRVVAACPANSPGCAFVARLTATSGTTVGTAQAIMRVADADNPGSYVDFTCSAPAAILASGPAASCSTSSPTTFLPGGTRLSATCLWRGSTVSVNAKVTCLAEFTPLGGE